MSEEIRNQINEIIRDEIQGVINDYVDSKEQTKGLGFVENEEELKVNISNDVVDRLIKEWNQFNFPQQKYILGKKDLIWIIAPWTWKKIPRYFLKSNKVLCTIHHIDEDKFNHEQENEFKARDKYVDHYHAISNKTYHQLKQITKKPITEIPWWVNQNIWFDININRRVVHQRCYDEECRRQRVEIELPDSLWDKWYNAWMSLEPAPKNENTLYNMSY